MKFGLRNVVPITNAPHWSALRGKYGGRLYSAPTQPVDYLKLLPDNAGDMGNAIYGDCFWAAAYHGRQARTEMATGYMLSESTDTVLDAYAKATGFVKGNPSTDLGTDPNQGFAWIAQNDLPSLIRGTPIKLWAAIELDQRNIDDCLEAADLCCGLSVGAVLPQYIVDVINSGGTPPAVWDAGPPSNEGHEIWVGRANPGFTDIGFESWGLKFQMTNAFWNQMVNQVTATVYGDWFEPTGKSPFNMTPDQLDAEMGPLRAGPIP